MTESDAVFPAWLLPSRRIIVFCHTCWAYHLHGSTDALTPYVTHLMAHCHAPDAPHGYYLFVHGAAPRIIIRDAKRRYSAMLNSTPLMVEFLAAYRARDKFLGFEYAPKFRSGTVQ